MNLLCISSNFKEPYFEKFDECSGSSYNLSTEENRNNFKKDLETAKLLKASLSPFETAIEDKLNEIINELPVEKRREAREILLIRDSIVLENQKRIFKAEELKEWTKRHI